MCTKSIHISFINKLCVLKVFILAHKEVMCIKRYGRKDRADGRTGRKDGPGGRTDRAEGTPHPPKIMKIECF